VYYDISLYTEYVDIDYFFIWLQISLIIKKKSVMLKQGYT